MDDRWTAYLFTSMNMGTVQPKYGRFYAMPKMFTVFKAPRGTWCVVYVRPRDHARFESHHPTGGQALEAVRIALDHGLGYPR